MNILPIQINNRQYVMGQNHSYNSKGKGSALQNNKDLSKNSLPELLGRYQVSFSGINKNNGPVFEHDCSEFMGQKEHIEYNKEDGSFTHIIYNRDGSLKRKEEFFPLEHKEVVTIINSDNTSVTTSIKGAGSKKEVFDLKGRQIYLRIIDEQRGNKKTVETDYEKGREITTDIINGNKEVKIIDLNTNRRVYSGELAQRRKYDKKTNSYITENIITGEIVKIERYNNAGEIVSLEEYYEGLGVISRKADYNPKTGGYKDISYYENGSEKSVVTSKSIEDKEVIEYEPNGREKTRELYAYNSKREKISKTIFIPGTSIIREATTYSGNKRATYFYGKNPNVPEYAEVYRNDILVKELSFYMDGKSISHERIHNNDNSYQENFYTVDGKKTESHFYIEPDKLVSVCEYDVATGVKTKTIEIDQYTNDIKETLYNKQTGNIKKILFVSSDKKVKEIIGFYDDGHTPKYRNIYNSDGSYSKTIYDLFGNPLKTKEFNADGTAKKTSARQAQSNDSSSDSLSDDEFICDMSDLIGKQGGSLNISDKQYSRLAVIFGLDDLKSLKSMDKSTYRKLCKKYNQLKDKEVFQIINALYHSPYNVNSGK